MPAGGVGHEFRPGDPTRNLERLDDREPDAVNPHRVLADRVGCDVGQPLLHVLADKLITVAVQDEPDRRAALTLHSQRLRQPDDTEDRFAQFGPALTRGRNRRVFRRERRGLALGRSALRPLMPQVEWSLMPVVERAHLPGMVLGPAELRTMDLCAGGLLLGRPKAQLPLRPAPLRPALIGGRT